MSINNNTLPTPDIPDESKKKYLTKKECLEAGVPLRRKLPPKSPVKQSSLLPVKSNGAISVSFLDKSLNNLSKSYSSEIRDSFFNQCFYDKVLIGEGAFGVVYRVRQKLDDEVYAVKKSKAPFRSSYDEKAKYEEVRKHELIPKHPNCVQFHGAWTESNYMYIQMEYCDTTLELFAAEHHDIPEEILWDILIDMLLAVKNLHDANLIHLDIKLENILLCSNGVCKLADFGLVTEVDKANGDSIEGDQKYLAPELLNGIFSKAADIFSLGVVMLELVFDLMLPQNGELWQRLRNDIFPENIKKISDKLYDVIKMMMRSNYLIRPTVDELLDSLKFKLHEPRHLNYTLVTEFLSKVNNHRLKTNLPAATSTPIAIAQSNWHVNVSPLFSDDEEFCEAINLMKKRSRENNNDISTSNECNSLNNSTPRFLNKKSRINNATVGRQLFI